MTKAERCMEAGPRGLAWRCTSGLRRWIWCTSWLAGGASMFYGAGLPWDQTLSSHAPTMWYYVVDLLIFACGSFFWYHAWMAYAGKICPLPCNSFHPNWEMVARRRSDAC